MDIKRDFLKVARDVLTETDLVLTEAQDTLVPGVVSEVEDVLSRFFLGVENGLGKGHEYVLDLKERVEKQLN